MKVVALTGERQSTLVDKPDPKAGENIVVVKITSAPMCNEYNAFEKGDPSTHFGHEAAGIVHEVAQPCMVEVGDRVVVMPQSPCGKCDLCRAGDYIHCQSTIKPLEITGSEAGGAMFAQYAIKSDWQLIPIPDGMSIDHGSMACCGLGPTFGAMQSMNVGAVDTVLITGMGPVGLGGVINARYRGARVIAVESHPYRVRLAKTLGASDVIDPTDESAAEQVRELTEGRGADKSIETSGVRPAKQFLVDATRHKGQVAIVGWDGAIECRPVVQKGLTIHGAWHWNLADAPVIMKTIADCADQIDKLITHTFPMSGIQEAWELQTTRDCGKVILHPWEEG